MVKPQESALLLCLVLGAVATAAGRAQTVSTEAPATDPVTKVSPDGEAAAEAAPEPISAGDAAEGADNTTAAEQQHQLGPVQYPFRDLPADVLRDFPGLCFGSTALRLFQVGQSWSLTPFCGVATCLVSRDGYHLMERVQDCGPQPLRNPKCKNVNLDTDQPFPHCCPVFECEEGIELEYPTQEELQRLAHEAAQAAVRAQYEEDVVGDKQTARVAAPADAAVEQAPVEEETTEAVILEAIAPEAVIPEAVVPEAVVPEAVVPEPVDAVEEESPKAEA
ncbi:Single domain Von Willebrand factor type C domain [Trinorchestia longiramus]|nr:Single domain Von Willebrand factor type C domain [Trinorchestia longiramus]